MTAFVDTVGDAVRNAAQVAVLPRFQQLTTTAIIEKSPGDWVTDADHECEELLTAALNSIEPGVPVIGEEAAAADPSVLHGADQHDRVWVLDPVDGTKSFIDGSPDFATMLALVERNAVKASWIWQPVHGHLFTAERGQGAMCDGIRLAALVEPRDDPATWRGVLRTWMMPSDVRAAALSGFVASGLEHAAIAAAGMVYPMAATGALTHALYWRTLPWDHAPGTLLASEAGMTVARLDGSEYRPFDDRFGVLSAVNPTVWDAVRGALPRQLPCSSRP